MEMTSQIAITWAPLLPWPVLAALTGLAALTVGLALARRARGARWRAFFIAVILLLLANPSVVAEQRQPLDDIALVVVDESPSQRISPRPDQGEQALAGLLESLERLPDTEVRLVRASGLELGQGDGGTRLFAAVRSALSEISRERLAGVVVVSDGQVHDVPDSLEQLAIDAPLHLLLTGRPEEADRRLTLSQVPGFGIVGRTLSMSLRVDDLPAGEATGQALVRVLQDGRPVQELRMPVGEEREVEFELDHRGPTVLEVEVEPADGELTLINNRAAAVVNGVRDRLRVLLVSGEPHSGERAWRNILKSDPSVDLVHFTILRPPEKQDGTPIRELSLIAFPTRELFELKLAEFDLVIFDRYRRRRVLPSLYLGNIARYVREGGALFEAVGPTFATPLSLYRTPLGRVLPGAPTGDIIERAFHPRVTELGHRHPVTAALPGSVPPGSDATPDWGRWFRQIETEASSGRVLMAGADERPLLILDRVGEGRVAQLTSDQMWLWSRGFEGGGPQAEMIRRVAHWLMKEPDLEEEDLRARVVGERLEIERRSLESAPDEIEVTRPDGSVAQVPLETARPGTSVGQLQIDEGGLYRVSDGERIALAAAGPLNPLEYADVRASAEPLAPLIEASGGGLVPLHAALAADGALPSLRKVRPDRDRHGDDWLGLLANQRYLVTGVERVPLLPALLALALVVGSLLAAWRREGS